LDIPCSILDIPPNVPQALRSKQTKRPIKDT